MFDEAMAKIEVQNTQVKIISYNDADYISLTDLARHKSDEPSAVIALSLIHI